MFNLHFKQWSLHMLTIFRYNESKIIQFKNESIHTNYASLLNKITWPQLCRSLRFVISVASVFFLFFFYIVQVDMFCQVRVPTDLQIVPVTLKICVICSVVFFLVYCVGKLVFSGNFADVLPLLLYKVYISNTQRGLEKM